MNTALVTLSDTGLCMARSLKAYLPEAKVFVHQNSHPGPGEEGFSSLFEVTSALFSRFRALIYFAPAGVLVRVLSGFVRDKKKDPAVVQIDAGGRFAVSLLCGHEGGANRLACFAASVLGAVPVVSTATEALKDIVLGVGCRKGTDAVYIRECIMASLEKKELPLERVRVLATAGCKSDEPGIKRVSEDLDLPLYVVPDSEIRRKEALFIDRALVREKVGLPGVAEPAAILAGHGAELIGERELWPQASVALARENFMWSE